MLTVQYSPARGDVADPQLRLIADIHAEVEPAALLAELIAGDVVAVIKDVLPIPLPECLGLDEEALRHIERLIEAGRQRLLGSELNFIAPLASEAVHPGPLVLQIEDETARIAVARSPWSMATICPLTMSVATAR